MLRKNIGVLLFLIVFGVSAAFAQKAHTPAKNSPERAAILNALRVPVSKELKQKISFLVNDFKVLDGWAFVGGQARNASGGALNWKITEYQRRIDADVFEDNLFALLKKSGNKWRVVIYTIGCNDVCYLDWDTQYKAPKAIIP